MDDEVSLLRQLVLLRQDILDRAADPAIEFSTDDLDERHIALIEAKLRLLEALTRKAHNMNAVQLAALKGAGQPPRKEQLVAAGVSESLLTSAAAAGLSWQQILDLLVKWGPVAGQILTDILAALQKPPTP